MSNSKEQKKMLALNLKSADDIVKFIIAFYDEKHIKTEKDLIKMLEKKKPLRTAIELQKKLQK